MKDDGKTECGVGNLTLFPDGKGDPYIDACRLHDEQTTEGSNAEKILSLSQVQSEFEHNIDVIRDRNSGSGAIHVLGSFYKLVTRAFTWMFWEKPK